MANGEVMNFLVDGVKAVGIHNGVARVEFFRLNGDGRPMPVLELAIPLAQAKSIAEAFGKAAAGK